MGRRFPTWIGGCGGVWSRVGGGFRSVVAVVEMVVGFLCEVLKGKRVV